MAPAGAIFVIAFFTMSYKQSTQTAIIVSGNRNVFIHDLHSGKVILSILRCIAVYLALLLTVQGIEPNPGPLSHGSFEDNAVFKKRQPGAVPGTEKECKLVEEDPTQATITCLGKTKVETAIDIISQTQTTIASLKSCQVQSAIAYLESKFAQPTIACVERTHGAVRPANTVPATNDEHAATDNDDDIESVSNDDLENVPNDEVDSVSDDEEVYASDYMSDNDSIDSLPFDDVQGECSTANDDAYYEEGYMTDDDVESLPYDDIDDEARNIEGDARNIDVEARNIEGEATSELYRPTTGTISMEDGELYFDENAGSINVADIIVRKKTVKFAMVDDVVCFNKYNDDTTIGESIDTELDVTSLSDDYSVENLPCDDAELDDLSDDDFVESLPCDDAELHDLSDGDSVESLPCDDAEMDDLSNDDSVESLPCDDAGISNISNEETEDLANKPSKCQHRIQKFLAVAPSVSSYGIFAEEDQTLKESDITVHVPSHHVDKTPSSPTILPVSASSNSKNVYAGNRSDDNIAEQSRTLNVREAVKNPDRKRKWQHRIKRRRRNKYKHNIGDESIRMSLSAPTICNFDNNPENHKAVIPSHTEAPCSEKRKGTKRKWQGRKNVTHSGKQFNKFEDMSDTVQVTHKVIPTIHEDSRTSDDISVSNQNSSPSYIKPMVNEIGNEIQTSLTLTKIINMVDETGGVSMFYQNSTDGLKKTHISRFKDRMSKKKNKKRHKQRECNLSKNEVNNNSITIDATSAYEDIKPEYLTWFADKLTKTERNNHIAASVWTAEKKKVKPLKKVAFLRRFL